MKKAEIVLGGKYENNAGTVREVIGVGPEFVLYRGQAETDNLRYRVIKKGRRCTGPTEGNSTRGSFASWAKSKVSE